MSKRWIKNERTDRPSIPRTEEERASDSSPETCYAVINLNEIKEAMRDILPGPWRYEPDNGTVWSEHGRRATPNSNLLSRVCDATGKWAMHDPTYEFIINANLRFIAQCREWIPALVSEVEKLRLQTGGPAPPEANGEATPTT